MTPFAENPQVRKVIYTVLWVLGLILGAAEIYVGAVPGIEQPGWLTGALAVFPFIAGYVGFQASQNTPAAKL
jgi:hypothetical protein